jgi:hypothetical protein
MWVLLIPVVGFATIVGVLGLAISGVAHVVMGIHGLLRKQRWLAWLAEGGIELVLVILLTRAPFVAVDQAERSNDWVDVDSDGMLDGFANGSYDWLDINGGDFAFGWARLIALIVTPAALGLYALSKLPDPSDDRP